MALNWTPEKISQLSLEEVKRLADNAKARGGGEVFALCQVEIQARKSKASGSLPEGFVKAARSAIAKNLEHDAVGLLANLAKHLATRYDLSPEKARVLSDGTKRFIPHRLTDAKGRAKVGGAQKSGLVVFDRYISYRLNDQIYALVALLPQGDEAKNVQYQVVGPMEILTNARHISELRPYLPQGTSIGLTEFAEEFSNFEEAAERFSFLMDQVAPKR